MIGKLAARSKDVFDLNIFIPHKNTLMPAWLRIGIVKIYKFHARPRLLHKHCLNIPCAQQMPAAKIEKPPQPAEAFP
ncbi:hypothetical protein EDS67_29625 [candidate division KSB1 bacterium]|nr:MAG: hypothetical protein EDS67_29625 [candidate division KSB1 bacterium]MCE7945679.1 hypothetical protein [Chlorobi bacterium CHB1]